MAPGQQASAEGMAVEGAEDEGEEDLAATTSVEAAGVADTAMTTRTTDAVADGQEGRGAGGGRGRGRRGRGGRGGGAASMKSTGNESESRDDRFPGQFFFVSTQASAGLEKDEGFEEPAAVGKVTLHSLDYWVIDSGATYSMTPRADLLTELEPSPVKHVTLALGQRAEVKGMGKAMFKGADGKMVGLKNVFWVPNLAANLISVRRLQKAGMDTSSKGAKTYTARLGERILWDLHEDRDVYNEMWQIPVVPIPKERQVAASISTKGEAFGSGDGANGRAKEMKSKKCNLGGTSKLGEHEESGAAAQRQHKGEENPKAEAEEEYGENMWGTIASAAFSNPTSATGECDWLTLHRRMGHVALPILQQLVKDEMVAGIRVKGGPDEGRAIDFDVWVDDLQLFLQCDRADGLSLFDLTSGASLAPAADADATVRSQWATRDAAARLAVRRHLTTSERAYFSQYKSAQTLYNAVVARYSSPPSGTLSGLYLPSFSTNL
ncbi:unnamed protein product, partial [Closterium sp. NIES-53]